MNSKTNGNLLRSKRAFFSYSQSDMAEFLDISPASFSNKESGKRCFNQEEIKKIIKVLKLNQQDTIDIFFDNCFTDWLNK